MDPSIDCPVTLPPIPKITDEVPEVDVKVDWATKCHLCDSTDLKLSCYGCNKCFCYQHIIRGLIVEELFSNSNGKMRAQACLFCGVHKQTPTPEPPQVPAPAVSDLKESIDPVRADEGGRDLESKTWYGLPYVRMCNLQGQATWISLQIHCLRRQTRPTCRILSSPCSEHSRHCRRHQEEPPRIWRGQRR